MARRFAVIGLGTFGFQLAIELEKRGGEVLVIDKDPDVIQDIRDHVTRAVIGDALDRDVLREIGVAEVDCVVIGLRSRLDASILATMYVQELGVKEIIVQAVSDDHRRALARLGASRVIFPEADMAARVASHLIQPNVIDYLWATPGYGIVELRVPQSFVGNSLIDLNIRQQYGVTIVAVRSPQEFKAAGGRRKPEEAPPFVPSPDYIFKPGDVLIATGKSEDLKRFPEE